MSISKRTLPISRWPRLRGEALTQPVESEIVVALSDCKFRGSIREAFRGYERAFKALPGSYKLWHAYLQERLEFVRNLPVTDPQYETLNNTFERALVTMHKNPRIWIMYLQSLVEQKLITRTRRTFDRALCALPVTQHDRTWEMYLVFVRQKGIPIETSLRVNRRYLKYDPSHIEDFTGFLLSSGLWQESAEILASVSNDDAFYSIKGKTKRRLWLGFCDLLATHVTEDSGLNVSVKTTFYTQNTADKSDGYKLNLI